MNDRFKFRVFDKETGKYYKSRISKGSGCVVYQHPSSGHCQWIQISTLFAELEQDEKTYTRTGVESDTIIEQCISLKDKNGNLVYEGDTVRCSDGNIYNICWSDSAMSMIAVNTTTKIGDAIYKLKCYEFEIIGNIHETKGE